ncbi:protein-L-isoaspartate(D-aspartate) O-methyltransferase [Streptomyces sp. CA2R106]|uniref:protein-L-isoaspartate(D-aspartate) O-methyltransferase n=1 Tax=Streptomyces sp. CA2R106 TaxID=3120153 RepID=UPI003008C1ED
MSQAWDCDGVGEGWEEAFRAVAREAFLPEVIWPYDMRERRSVMVARSRDLSAWREFAAGDVPIVTQWDDGAHEGTSPGRVATSSSSMPSVVAAMLADRLGAANVTTVEVDPAVAAAARAALKRTGHHPTVITGDGRTGHAARAPYERVIATCGVRAIPRAWMAQTAPGGLIVAPWGTHFGNGDAVVRLEVADGVAVGWFTRRVEFMKLRAQRTAVQHTDRVPPEGIAVAEPSTTELTEADLLGTGIEDLPFLLGLRLHGCVQAVADRRGATRPVWFYGRTDPSWAVVVFHGSQRPARVWQSGPRRLWAEVEAAVRWWQAQGRPGLDRFGLTATAGGTSTWLDTPGNVISSDGPPR